MTPSQAAAERRRSALRAFLEDRELTAAELARLIGKSNGNAIYNFLNGRSRSLSSETIERILEVFPSCSAQEIFGQPLPNSSIRPVVGRLDIRVEIRAGFRRSSFHLPAAEQINIPMPVEEAFHTAGSFGAVVRAPGAEVLYPNGTYLVCLPFEGRRDTKLDKRKVILRSTNAAGVETTLREVIAVEKGLWLWPRSTHPEHQSPIRLPCPYLGQPWSADGQDFQVAGVVAASYQPEMPHFSV